MAEQQSKFSLLMHSLFSLADFLFLVFLLSLFFQGTVPGMQALREAFRQIYSFLLDPDNIVITGVIFVRLIVFGISRCCNLQ